MRLDFLRGFIAVVEAKNFTHAAEKLHIAQPALTKQIASLEESLNTKLLTRTTRSVELTDQGKLFLEASRRIIDLFDSSVQDIQLLNEKASKHLIIGLSYLYLSATPVSWIEDFKKLFPDVIVDIKENTPEVILDKIVEGSLDATVLGLTDFGYIPGKLKSIELFTIEEEIIVYKRHRLAKKGYATIEDLKEETFVYPYMEPSIMISPVWREMLEHGYAPPIIQTGFEKNALEVVEAEQAIMGLPTSRPKIHQDIVAIPFVSDYAITAYFIWNPQNKKDAIFNLIEFIKSLKIAI